MMSPVEMLRRKRRRLRRKYLKLSRHRRDPGRFHDWLDRETYRSLLPLIPAGLVWAVWGPSTFATLLVVVAIVIGVGWFLFVYWQILVIASRKRDKQYRLVTRKHLSREYREDAPKPRANPPPTWDDLA
jgi:hypothetical protein